MAGAPTVGVGPGNAGTGLSITPGALPSHAAGDVLIVQLDFNGTNAVTRPAGWNLLRETVRQTVLKQGLYWFVATSASTPVPTFTIGTTSRTWTANSQAWAGADPALVPVGQISTSGGSSTTHTSGTVPATDAPGFVHVFTLGKLAGTNSAVAAPAGYAEQYEVDNSTTVSSWMAYRALTAAGAVPAVSATDTVGAAWVTQAFTLRSLDYPLYRSGAPIPVASWFTADVPVPAGMATGDAQVAHIRVASAVAVLTAPAGEGWTQLGTPLLNAAGTHGLHTWVRRVPAGTPGTSIFGMDNFYEYSGLSVAYRNVVAAPEALVAAGESTASGTASPASVAGFTPDFDNTRLLLLAQTSLTAGFTYTAGTGQTERMDTLGAGLFDEVWETADATGVRSATIAGTSPNWAARLVALKGPESAAGATLASTDAAGRLRLRIRAFDDVASRIRLRVAAVRDTAARLRVRLQQWAEHAGRLRLRVATVRDTAGRLRLQVAAVRDVAGRFALVVTSAAVRDVATRVRLRAAAVRDAAARFRVRVAAWRDVGGRLRLAAPILRDASNRLRLRVAATRDTASRARFAMPSVRDAGARFVLALGSQARARVSWLVLETPLAFLRDAAARFRLSAVLSGVRDTAARVRLRVAVVRDVAGRFRLRTTAWSDVATRLRLRATNSRDAAGRLVLVVPGQAFRETAARLRVRATRWHDAAGRVRVGVLAWRDAAARLRLALPSTRDAAGRVRLRVGGTRDAAARFFVQSVTGVARDTSSRLRVRAERVRDTAGRARLRVAGSRDAAGRFPLAVRRWAEVAHRLRVRAIVTRDAAGRVQLRVATVADAAGRTRMAVQVVRDTAGRLRVVRGGNRDAGARFLLIADQRGRLTLVRRVPGLELSSRHAGLTLTTRAAGLTTTLRRPGLTTTLRRPGLTTEFDP